MQQAPVECDGSNPAAAPHLPWLAAPGPAPVRMPMVAAIVCNFNQGAYVSAAIAAVAQQTYQWLECVVVDDCSTDGSADTISRVLSEQSTRSFRFIRHEQNRGQMAAMLSGLDATTAPFVAWLDADDIWLPNYIERHIAHHLNSQVNAALSTANLAVIDGEDVLLAGVNSASARANQLGGRDRLYPFEAAQRARRPAGEDHWPAAGPVFVDRQHDAWLWSPTSGLVFRRATIEAIRPQRPERLRICADNYLARFAHIVGGTIRIGETLGCYRVHGSNSLATRAVYGDGPVHGVEPPHIRLECNVQIVTKLLDPDGPLPAIMPVRQRWKAAFRLLGKRSLRRQMPFKLKAWVAGRYAVERLRMVRGRKVPRPGSAPS